MFGTVVDTLFWLLIHVSVLREGLDSYGYTVWVFDSLSGVKVRMSGVTEWQKGEDWVVSLSSVKVMMSGVIE